MVGKNLSHYKIESELGRGGMGVVYKARDSRLNRDVALKVLAEHLIRDESSHERFMQEARAVAALSHANICTLFDIGDDEGKQFLVMEFVPGESLQDVISRGNIPVEDAQRLAAQIAYGLERAHETGIVHRDIKPANIMVTPRGEIKIMDFGLAKLTGSVDLTKTGSTIGTALYMSPEQARGDSLDPASDVWSLGVVLFELLTGERPFKGQYDAALIYSILNTDPEMPDLDSEELGQLLRQMFNKEANHRPTAGHIAAVLSGTSTTSASVFVPQQAASTTVKSARVVTPSNRWILSILAVILVVTAIWQLNSRQPSVNEFETLSIAVIPFVDLNPDRANDYLGEGLAESLVSMLTGIDDVTVQSINSTRQYRGNTDPLSKIGAQLNSRFVLQGSIQNIGERIRLTVYLSDTDSELELWREQIDADFSELFTLQDSVSATVSRVILDQFDIGTPGAVAVLSGTADVDAYHFFLRGRFAHQQRDSETAVVMFDSALVRDPDYAEAMIRKSYSLATLVSTGKARFSDVHEEGISLAERAAELEPDNPRPLMALASFYGFNLEFERALDYAAQSYRRDSLDTQSIIRYTVILRAAGHINTTMRLLRRAVTLDPLDPSLTFSHSGIASHLGLLDEARAGVEAALQFQPNDPMLMVRMAEVYALSGDYERAIEIIEPIAQFTEDPLLIYFAAAFHGRMGSAQDVTRWADALDDMRDVKYIPFSVRSDLESYMGNHQRAEVLFQRAVDEREPWTSLLGMGFSPVSFLNSATYVANASLLRTDNPWMLAKFDQNGLVLNADEIQAAADTADGRQ